MTTCIQVFPYPQKLQAKKIVSSSSDIPEISANILRPTRPPILTRSAKDKMTSSYNISSVNDRNKHNRSKMSRASPDA